MSAQTDGGTGDDGWRDRGNHMWVGSRTLSALTHTLPQSLIRDELPPMRSDPEGSVLGSQSLPARDVGWRGIPRHLTHFAVPSFIESEGFQGLMGGAMQG